MVFMRVSDFSYDLPEELIALHPPKVRGQSRLLVLNRYNGNIEHRNYNDFTEYLRPGDVVVLNNTKVIKARLVASNNKGQNRELLLLEDHHNTDFRRRLCLYRGSLRAGEELDVKGTKVTVTDTRDGGIAEISSQANLLELAEKAGQVPLPPYLHRDATKADTKRYQTVFAREPGSVAAPTASLNFTEGLQKAVSAKGAEIAYLTLHVGLGTFLPIRTDVIEQHQMHSEYFEIPKATVEEIQDAKRVIAVGTTVARTLEFVHKQLHDTPRDIRGEANIFIYPGYEFQVIDGLLTNFHAPKSTVLMLAAAFAGWDNLKHAYDEAIREKYALLSYGDSMLII